MAKKLEDQLAEAKDQLKVAEAEVERLKKELDCDAVAARYAAANETVSAQAQLIHDTERELCRQALGVRFEPIEHVRDSLYAADDPATQARDKLEELVARWAGFTDEDLAYFRDHHADTSLTKKAWPTARKALRAIVHSDELDQQRERLEELQAVKREAQERNNEVRNKLSKPQRTVYRLQGTVNDIETKIEQREQRKAQRGTETTTTTTPKEPAHCKDARQKLRELSGYGIDSYRAHTLSKKRTEELQAFLKKELGL